MPGPRQKLSVLEGNGRKHLSKTEKAQRAAQEVNLPKPDKMPVPKWLPKEYRTAYRNLSKQLLEADMGMAVLDADTVARYVVAVALYDQTTQQVNDLMIHAEERSNKLMDKLGEALAEQKPDPVELAEMLEHLVAAKATTGKALAAAVKNQNTYFTQARACANDMGMTITSRCRLILPESSQPKEPNAFEEMLRRKMQG